jgi:hypothetical protein
MIACMYLEQVIVLQISIYPRFFQLAMYQTFIISISTSLDVKLSILA